MTNRICGWPLLACAVLVGASCDRSGTSGTPSKTSTPSSAAPPPALSAVATGAGPASGAPRASSSAKAGTDTLMTSAGPVTFHPVQHATFWMDVGGKIVWFDPWSKGNLDGPKADVVLITDSHPDHLDKAAIDKVKKPSAKIVGPKTVADALPGVEVIANGEERDLGFLRVKALPMYNHKRGPSPGKLYHVKGRGNGYLLEIGDRRVYVSGDTACIPEMKALERIDVAFVCMNLPYTMPPLEAAECVKAFGPKVLYPYHYRGSDLDELTQALAGTATEVRKREWY